jgi:hypothetical protein
MPKCLGWFVNLVDKPPQIYCNVLGLRPNPHRRRRTLQEQTTPRKRLFSELLHQRQEDLFHNHARVHRQANLMLR